MNIYGRYSNEVVKKHEEYHLNLWLNTFYNFESVVLGVAFKIVYVKIKMKKFILILFLLMTNFLFAIEFSIDNHSVYGSDLYQKLKNLSQDGFFSKDGRNAFERKHFSEENPYFWNPLIFSNLFTLNLQRLPDLQEDCFQIYFIPYQKSLALSFPDLKLRYFEFEKSGNWGWGTGLGVGNRKIIEKKINVTEKLICPGGFKSDFLLAEEFDFNVVRVLTRYNESVLTISFDSKDEAFFRFIKSLYAGKEFKFLNSFDSFPDNDSIIIELQKDLSKTERYILRFSVSKKMIPEQILLKYPNLK
ncbi:MAG: hypothetical protein K6B46_01605 [Opitutales bacterium]|nr:hypothetical protein [Opitutales bacterium]